MRGVQGVTVDGRTGPISMHLGLTDEWDARFYFGRTKAGRVVIARLEISTGRSERELPENHELTMEVIRKITIARVQRYLEEVNRPTHEPTVKRPRASSPIKSANDLKRLLARHDQLGKKYPGEAAKMLAIEIGQNRSTVRTWLRRAKGL